MRFVFLEFENNEIPYIEPENDHEITLANFISSDVRDNYSSYLIDVRRGMDGYNYKYSFEANTIKISLKDSERQDEYSIAEVRSALKSWREFYLQYNLCDLTKNRLSKYNIAWSFLIYLNNRLYNHKGNDDYIFYSDYLRSIYINEYYEAIFETADALTTDPNRVKQSLYQVFGEDAIEHVINAFMLRNKERLLLFFNNHDEEFQNDIYDYFERLEM